MSQTKLVSHDAKHYLMSKPEEPFAVSFIDEGDEVLLDGYQSHDAVALEEGQGAGN